MGRTAGGERNRPLLIQTDSANKPLLRRGLVRVLPHEPRQITQTVASPGTLQVRRPGLAQRQEVV